MDGNPKQQVAEKLRNSSSVLITVSNDPSVDQLASAIGLSLMLTKLGKHTTTVFSGTIPNVLGFLEPEKTIDSTVDGLRDFIISLDKEKADKLRYKVEDDVVKIFITPFKDKITDADLNFSQGDFNVDLVVALGVHKRGELDGAITAHGRILHDATIITINSANGKDGNLGAVDWTDEQASCLSEMLVSISEALEGGILDQAMSTAFLTGIVAATDRFKNDQTTPKVMTMSAQLMAAGANQQLIATNLQKDEPKKAEKEEETPKKDDAPAEEGASISIDRDEDEKHVSDEDIEPAKPDHHMKAGDLHVNEDGLLTEIEDAVHANHLTLDENGRTKKLDGEDPAIKELEDELSHDSSSSLLDLEDKMKSFDPSQAPKQEAPSQKAQKQERDGPIGQVKSLDQSAADMQDKPVMGGTFNATAEEAHEKREHDREMAINKEVLSHKTIQPAQGPSLADVADDINPNDLPDSQSLMADLDAARREVEDAMDQSQFMNGPQPTQALNAAPLPLDGDGMEDFNLPQAPQTTTQLPQVNNPMQPQPGMQMPQQQMSQPQMQMPQMNNSMPQQNMGGMPQPQGPMPQNPLFNQQPQQQTFQQPSQPQQPMQPQPGMQMPPAGPPPMPPSAPPPMPPFGQ